MDDQRTPCEEKVRALRRAAAAVGEWGTRRGSFDRWIGAGGRGPDPDKQWYAPIMSPTPPAPHRRRASLVVRRQQQRQEEELAAPRIPVSHHGPDPNPTDPIRTSGRGPGRPRRPQACAAALAPVGAGGPAPRRGVRRRRQWHARLAWPAPGSPWLTLA